MAPEQLTISTNPALPGYWPSLASASAEIVRRKRMRSGRVQPGSLAVPGLTPPVVARRRDASLGDPPR